MVTAFYSARGSALLRTAGAEVDGLAVLESSFRGRSLLGAHRPLRQPAQAMPSC